MRRTTGILFVVATVGFAIAAFLDRETARADIAAFSYLYPLVNTNLLRRIEKPELPRSAFRAFARALSRLDCRRRLPPVPLGG